MIRSSFLFLRILTDFISRQWSHVADGSVRTQTKSRQTWFNSRGTIKNVHARFNVWIPQSKYVTHTRGHFTADRTCFRGSVLRALIRSNNLQQAPAREKVFLPGMNLNCFTKHSTSYIIKNPTGELFTYTPSGKVRTLS